MKRPSPLLLFLGLALCGVPTFADTGEPLGVEIVSPTAGQPLFDQVEIVVEVRSSSAIRRVVFYLDGQQLESLDAPPFSAVVDVGPENRDRRLRVVAIDAAGREAAAELLAPALHIDEGVKLELQQLYISVTTRHGRRVLTLGRDDFRIFDQERRQEIVTFEVGDLPLAAMVLVDGSLSMEGDQLASARRGVEAFADGLEPLDEASLFVFSDGIEHFQTLEAGVPLDIPQFREVRASGGTAINDHVYLALHRLEDRLGRRVVILLSDGRDNHSVLSAAEVRRVARESQALIYWVRLQNRDFRSGRYFPSSAWRDRFSSSREYGGLEETVRESGGRIITLRRDEEIEPAFRVILAELREQYALGYYPAPDANDGRWRKVRVEAEGRGLEVRVREGYYDR